MQGACFLACTKRSLTREAPTPTKTSTKSDPLILKNGQFASPATAFANIVFPFPGAPTSNIPFGIFAPKRVNFVGFFRNSIISFKSSFTSCTPATSLKVMLIVFGEENRALLFPIENILPGPLAPP